MTWKWERLINVSQFIIDCPHSTAKDEENGYPLIRTPNVGFGTLMLTNVHRVSKSVYDKRNERGVPQNGDLIFAREAPAGNIAVIETDEQVCLGQRTVLIRPIDSCVLPWFIAYYILSPDTQKNLVEQSTGTTVSHVNLNTFRPYLIPIPPLSEQRRIIAKLTVLLKIADKYGNEQICLSNLNSSIAESLRKSILQAAIQGKLVPQIASEGTAQELLEQIQQEKLRLVKEGVLKKSTLASSVIFKGDDNKYYMKSGNESDCIDESLPFSIPTTWRWVTLGELINDITGLSYKKELLSDKSDKMVRVLRGGNIEDGKMLLKPDDVMISAQYVPGNLYLQKNTFITPAVSSLEKIGKTALILNDLDNVVVGGFVLMLIPTFNNIRLINYLYYFFQTSYYHNYCKLITKKSGQAFYNLSRQKLKRCLVPIPPNDELSRILSRLDDVLASIMRK
jgi:type I restriction enzyme S subunit